MARRQNEFGDGVEEKEIIDKVMQIKGEIKGEMFLAARRYIRKRGGEEGLKKVDAQMKRMGFPIVYDEDIKGLGWYPIGIVIVALLAVKKGMNWNDEQIMRMGRGMPKFSFFTKMMLKNFVSLKRITKEAPNFWRKVFSIGSLEVVDFNEEKKYSVLHLKDLELHPIFCKAVQGYILGAVDLVKPFKKLTIEESKCVHRGDEYHEFVIRWED